MHLIFVARHTSGRARLNLSAAVNTLHVTCWPQAERIRRAVSKGGCEAKLSVVAEAPHNLRGHEDECARLVMDFVQSLGLPA